MIKKNSIKIFRERNMVGTTYADFIIKLIILPRLINIMFMYCYFSNNLYINYALVIKCKILFLLF